MLFEQPNFLLLIFKSNFMTEKVIFLVTYTGMWIYDKPTKKLMPLIGGLILDVEEDITSFLNKPNAIIPVKQMELLKGRLGTADTEDEVIEFSIKGDLLYFVKTGNVRPLQKI